MGWDERNRGRARDDSVELIQDIVEIEIEYNGFLQLTNTILLLSIERRRSKWRRAGGKERKDG